MTQPPPRFNSLRDERSSVQEHEVSHSGSAKAPNISTTPSTTSRSSDASKLNADTLSDKATAAFIRRTLCSHQTLSEGGGATKPIHELLPPLTSSNEVDLQLYALLAIIIKDFVNTWYAKITPDHVFVDEVVQIVAHCTRALEQRLRKVDLEALLLDEIPLLVDAHVTSFRTSHRPVYPPPLASSPHQIYHTLNPHPALSPVPCGSEPDSIVEQERNEEVWRQLIVQGVLAVLLPTEDLENGCLRALVGEILSEMIVRAALSERLCQSWLLWELITRVLEMMRPRNRAVTIVESGSKAAGTSRLEQFGLMDTEGPSHEAMIDHRTSSAASGAVSTSISGLFWTGVQYAFFAFTAARIVILALASSPSLPSRCKTWPVVSKADGQARNLRPRPVVSFGLWRACSRLIDLDLRMPWLAGLLSLLHLAVVAGPGRVDGGLDRVLYHTFQTHLFHPTHLTTLLRATRAAIFPNNAALAPPRPDPPSAEYVQDIKRKAAETIVDTLPKWIALRYFASDGDDEERRREIMLDQVAAMLDVLNDAYMNKHLVFGIVELVVVRLLPEVGEKGVEALMKERLGEMMEYGLP